MISRVRSMQVHTPVHDGQDRKSRARTPHTQHVTGYPGHSQEACPRLPGGGAATLVKTLLQPFEP